jgi:hypothetical protein
MSVVTITTPIYMQADELWRRVFGADPETFGGWWRAITYMEGDWDKAGLAEVILEDPEDEDKSVSMMLNAANLAAGLSDPAFPEHLRQDILNDNVDCVSADALIQHIVYGEIVFG